MAFLKSITVFFLCSSLFAAEVVSPVSVVKRVVVPPHSLVRVKLDTNEQVLIVKPDGNAVSFADQAGWSDGDGTGIVWTGEPGREYAMVVWGDTGPKYTIVEIEGYTPNPPDPGPEPNPNPEPVPPSPAPEIPNKVGIGKLAYETARGVSDPASAQILSKIYASAALVLSASNSGDEVEDINKAFKYAYDETEKQLDASTKPRWAAFRNQLKEFIDQYWRDGHQTKFEIVEVLDELSRALSFVK